VSDRDAEEGRDLGLIDRVRERRARPSTGAVMQGLIFIAVGLVMMWPVPLHPTTTFLGWRDANYNMWLSWRLGDLIASGEILGLEIPDVVIPYGSSVLLMDGLLPSLLGGLWNLFSGPFLAHNLTILTLTLLNMWAGARVGRRVSDHRGVWIVTGIAFASAPAIVMRMFVHLSMYAAFPVPLLLEQAIRVTHHDVPLNPFKIGALLLVAFLCSIYFFVFGGIAFVIFVLLGSADVKLLLRRAGAIVLAGLVAFVLMLPFTIPRIARDRAEKAAGGDPVLIDASFRSSADVLSIVAQPEPSAMDLPGSSRLRATFRRGARHESTIFPGFLVLIGGIGAVALLPLRAKRSILLTPLTLWLLALGTSLKIDGDFLLRQPRGQPLPWLPYTLLFHVPGFGSLRAPNRVSFALTGALIVGLAASLAWLMGRLDRMWQRALVFAVCGALLATNLLIPVPESRMEASAHVIDGLERIAARDDPDDAALVVPADCDNRTLPNVKLQIHHQAPLVGCQASSSSMTLYSGMQQYVRSPELASLRCVQQKLYSRKTEFKGREDFDAEDIEGLYQKFQVRYLIVDKHLMARRRCQKLRASLGELRRYGILAEDSHYFVVDLQATRPGAGVGRGEES
jgi:hypothetical protein